MATNTYFALTDGTTTLTFADGAGGSSWYKVQDGWAPGVATLRRNQLGGRSPAEDVVEEVPITISGSTAAHLYANVDALNSLLLQSAKYKRGEAVNAVTVDYSVRGGTVSGSANPFRALVLGQAGQAPMLELPPNYDGAGLTPRVFNARMRFLRRGSWIHQGASISGSTSGGSDGRIVSITLSASSPDQSPTLMFTGASVLGVGQSNLGNIFALCNSSSSTAMVSVSASAMTTGGTFSTPWNPYSVSGSVLRYTPSSTAATSSGSVSASPYVGAASNGYSVGIYACIAAPSTASTCYVSAVYGNNSTNPVILDNRYGNAYAAWYFMGVLPSLYDGSALALSLVFSAGSAAGYIEVDQLLLVNPYLTQVVMTKYQADSVSGSPYLGADGLGLQPTATMALASASPGFSYEGDAYLSSSSASVQVVIGAPGYSAGAGATTFARGASGTIRSITVRRNPAYYTPR